VIIKTREATGINKGASDFFSEKNTLVWVNFVLFCSFLPALAHRASSSANLKKEESS
jgi:hypothetical protein